MLCSHASHVFITCLMSFYGFKALNDIQGSQQHSITLALLVVVELALKTYHEVYAALFGLALHWCGPHSSLHTSVRSKGTLSYCIIQYLYGTATA